MGVEAKKRNIDKEAGNCSANTRNVEENPPCNAKDYIRAGLIVIEAWFGGY